MVNLTKIQQLTNVRTKLSSMYDSYNPNDFSSPNYEIPEEIARELSGMIDSKVLTVVRFFLDDTIENLYLNGVGDSLLEDISQSDLEGIFQLILNK